MPVEDERLGSLGQNTMISEVRFRALLTEGGAELFDFVRAW
jgi:hypothetical protein